MDKYVIGVDFGTDSVRALLVNTRTGEEAASAVAYYKRWAQGLYCDPSKNQFRQHPLDYIEGLTESITEALSQVPAEVRSQIVGIGIDTTGSTPCPVDRAGTPLALLPEFSDNPNAMFVLWKDHTAVNEAAEINDQAWNHSPIDYTKYVGGIYSSEWFWAKILHVYRHDPAVREAAYSWVEHCDWMPALLSGVKSVEEIKRSRCAAGHKAMWHEEWNGLPADEFFAAIDPLLKGVTKNMYRHTYPSDQLAGTLCAEWAEKLGLKPGIAIAVGAFDAHMGAVGGGVAERVLVKIMGTSTCDIMVAPYEVMQGKLVRGICGQVDGSVIPGMVGLEAGQSAFGDVFAWFRQVLMWPLEELTESGLIKPEQAEQVKDQILPRLTKAAEALSVEDTQVVALDWLNGRRTPDADQTLKGALAGLSLGTDAPRVFRALVEATAFGSKAVIDRFAEEGVKIDEVIALGGIPKKNPFVMQVTADVFDMPIKVARSDQACALGAAMFAAAAAKVYPDVQTAQVHMGTEFSETYRPRPEQAAKYREIYHKYLQIGGLLEDILKKL
ncbi:MAG: ribulokinase [Limnochordia bacterium]|jgi:L-ribulokinase|nr:ribulokinase [Bacillota bacterium]HOB08191.1 ribulokinase [Limnochordia bacterium]NLH31070.1 ribulokinase [Bacillota bacterium]HPT92304.1 ribulokinase [Limnochordia bacterium]HQD69872.1 ribulokinase [Limnochordia bacterium]